MSEQTTFYPQEAYLHLRVGSVDTCWLADRDRRRFRLSRHLDKHGCGTPGHSNYSGGFRHCPTAAALWDDMDFRDQILVAAS